MPPEGPALVPCSSSAPLCNVQPRPACNPSQTLRKLVLFLPRSLLLMYSQRGEQATLADLPEKWEADTRGLSPCRRPPFPAACPWPARSPLCPLCLCGKLRAALSWARLSCAGAQGSCRAHFQQLGSASALPAEQTPRSRTHFFPQGGAGSSTIPAFSHGEHSLSGTPAALGRSQRAAALPSLAGARSGSGTGLIFRHAVKKNPFFTITFSPFLFIFILFIPPVTVCGK